MHEILAFTGSSILGDPSHVIPLWVKLFCTAYVIVLVPVYWRHLGPTNFLWFSDIALFGTCVGLWIENSLMISMQAVSVLLLETIWIVDFAAHLALRSRFRGVSDYMFNTELPARVRGLSLFHIWLPPLMVWALYRLGYDRRAWWAQTLLAAIVLAVCYLVSSRKQNVNWVFGLWGRPQERLHPALFLVVLMLGFLLLVYLPTHLILTWTMPTP